MFIELVRRGRRVSVNAVAKPMAEPGPAGRKAERRQSLTRPGRRPAAPDSVHRDFTAEAPDLVRAGDMPEIDAVEGRLYLATVIDLFSECCSRKFKRACRELGVVQSTGRVGS
ncbi:hypothetical protein [Streptomyces sp. NPDC002588]|uniref:hypothetical protein n=1 Tax=Streptomyces sp. NPDC002588 TaxID=3154419 RepID=UPI003317FD74